jgi:hypothetical protein
VTTTGQGSLGYYTELNGGMTARLGLFRANFWELQSSPMQTTSRVPPVQGARTRGSGKHSWFDAELFGYGLLRPRVIGYNVLLQGQFRRSVHEFSASEIERLVTEFEAGLTTTLQFGGSHLVATWVTPAGRTPEFMGPMARTHTWGAVHVSFSFPSGP